MSKGAGWNWTATASISLATIAPLTAYLGFWGIVGIGHGPSSGSHALFYAGLALCILAGILGLLGFTKDGRRGRWLRLPAMAVGLSACWVIVRLWLSLSRRDFFPFAQ